MLTSVGLGMLIMIVMGMVGVYRGMIEDACLLIEKVNADFWVVQKGAKGPFAEVSRVSRKLVDRAAVVPGVARTREFVFHTIQRETGGRTLRAAVLGLSWPRDKGLWLPLIVGRFLRQPHYEIIADVKTGLDIGQLVEIGRDAYRVVGLTKGMVSSGGDGLVFMTVDDALAVQYESPPESIRLERESRKARASDIDLSLTQPFLLENAAHPSASIPAVSRPQVSAILVSLKPGADPEQVRSVIQGWEDVSVHSQEKQRQFMLKGTVEMARKQIGLFTVLLTLISGIIMALILYTLTLEKVHEIAILKLIGSPTIIILFMILQQALFLGGLGYGLAYLMGSKLFPLFPRRVIVMNDDLIILGVIVFVISTLSSILGIIKAININPNDALAG